jgi:hypothetical protein
MAQIAVEVRAELCQVVPVSKLDDLQRLKATKAARFAVPSPSTRNSSKGAGHVLTVPIPHLDHEQTKTSGILERAPLNGERPAAASSGPTSSKRGGRPLAKDAAKSLSRTKPWEAEGMSRRTWYRRKKEQEK